MKRETGNNKMINRMENQTTVRVIRNGLINMIPVLIIGAFALIFQTFPVKVYKNFIAGFLDGALLSLFNIIYCATFGVLSVYMTISISTTYMKIKADPDTIKGGAVFASAICFFILTGAYYPEFGLDSMGPKSMFLAILTGLGASSLYLVLERAFRNRRLQIFSAGADRDFSRMLSTFFPVLLVVLFSDCSTPW